MAVDDPGLLELWTQAMITIDLEHITRLYRASPELLWSPLEPVALDHDQRSFDADPRRQELLGESLEPFFAFTYSLLAIADKETLVNSEQARSLCYFLLKQSTSSELNTCLWGSGNTVLHLACFLGEVEIVSQLLDNGASAVIQNYQGFLAKDVAQTDKIAALLASPKKPSTKVEANTSARFKQLRLLAESPAMKSPVALDRQKSSRKYFLPGHVEERRRRVLDDDEEAEREKQRLLRQKEVETLTARSTVKNNPLFKKLEGQHQLAVPIPAQEAAGSFRRTSKVINSLKDRSVVSTSVFRQTPSTSFRQPSPLAQSESSTEIMAHLSSPENPDTFIHEELDAKMINDHSDKDDVYVQAEIPISETGESVSNDTAAFTSSESVSEYTEESHRFSKGSEISSMTSKSTYRYSESDVEQWFDSVEDSLEGTSRPTSRCQPTDEAGPTEVTHNNTIEAPLTLNASEQQEQKEEKEAGMVQSTNNDYASDSDEETIRGFAMVMEEREEHTTRPSVDDASVESSIPFQFHSRPQSDNVESIESWSPSSPRPTDLSDIQKRVSRTLNHGDSAYGSISQKTTFRYVASPHSDFIEIDPAHGHDRGIPSAHEVSTTTSSQDPAVLETMQTAEYGKLYVHVKGVQSMLLPLPRETTYVRCVVSDGKYEYMSRYEVLDQRVEFDYECIVDTVPDMIITVSLHVRPDSHVKPHSSWTRLFSSIRKQKESLCGYVHPQDSAIGQTRFALAHMIHACHQQPYRSDFECFNSWYARTARERQRRNHQDQIEDSDVLKVVGNLAIDMLYLPVSTPAAAIPPTLRECDLTLKIRQWHETSWHSGYLATRVPGSDMWQRRFFRLVGSQLMGFGREDDPWAPTVRYDIADAVGLSAATDKVIVSLSDEQDDPRLFKPEAICDDTRRGFFRITFPTGKVDCVSDDVDDSEQWVKTLAAMIGRIPLKIPYTVFKNELTPLLNI